MYNLVVAATEKQNLAMTPKATPFKKPDKTIAAGIQSAAQDILTAGKAEAAKIEADCKAKVDATTKSCDANTKKDLKPLTDQLTTMKAFAEGAIATVALSAIAAKAVDLLKSPAGAASAAAAGVGSAAVGGGGTGAATGTAGGSAAAAAGKMVSEADCATRVKAAEEQIRKKDIDELKGVLTSISPTKSSDKMEVKVTPDMGITAIAGELKRVVSNYATIDCSRTGVEATKAAAAALAPLAEKLSVAIDKKAVESGATPESLALMTKQVAEAATKKITELSAAKPAAGTVPEGMIKKTDCDVLVKKAGEDTKKTDYQQFADAAKKATASAKAKPAKPMTPDMSIDEIVNEIVGVARADATADSASTATKIISSISTELKPLATKLVDLKALESKAIDAGASPDTLAMMAKKVSEAAVKKIEELAAAKPAGGEDWKKKYDDAVAAHKKEIEAFTALIAAIDEQLGFAVAKLGI
jgi:hypothetical protein